MFIFLGSKKISLHVIIQVALVLFAFQSSNAQLLSGPMQQDPVAVDSSQQIADKIVNSKIPVLVDFWAPWCGPCRILNPIIKDLEKTYKGKALFLKINVDIHQQIAAYFGVSSIPAVFIIKDKSVVKALPGLQPKEEYIKALNEVLSSKKSSKTDSQSVTK